MKESPKLWCCAALVVLVPLASAGCASAHRALEQENHTLQNEISRLKADKANLSARAAALEDETLVLEKKAQQCAANTRPTLAVVRLEAEGETEADRDPQPEVRDREISREPRPVLTLGPGGAVHSAGTGAGVRSIPSSATGLAFDNADNLGVTAGAASTASTPSDMDAFNEGYRLFANGKHSEALTVLGSFVASSAGHAYADDALFWRGECYLAMGKPLRAVGEFERLLSRYPSSDKTASALWRIGYAYDRLGDSTQALAHYFRVVDEYPTTEVARKASQRVAVLQGTPASGRVVSAAAP